MGCVESSRRVKEIRVVQQGANKPDFRRGSKGILSGCRPPRTPLPNMVDSGFEDELTAIATIDLGESFDSRHSYGGAVRPSGLSPDSGIFELIGNDYSGVVTEFDTVPRMEDEFRLPRINTELLNGSACPPRVSALRKEEAAILNRLHQEGLITRPKATTSGGLSYDLVTKCEDSMNLGPGARLPPIKLKKLEKRRSRHRVKTPLNEEQFYKKLQKAEERRKEVEMERTRRISERIASAKPLGLQKLENLAKLQKNMEKFEITLENRATYLQNMRDRLKEHNQKAAGVRMKKARTQLDFNSTHGGLEDVLRVHGEF
ncbi:uncharacterized protein LOC132197364 [Neocloeon triangulifer]|uniref:uncharacterized protein LOC132197364 n=1 Tax=Neocloeon triangulifer TaxID=2078957 RepID=UPI00286F11A5|nr:uncharacterized protein LOC132197364 [Neocloeon triangulifer]